MDRLLKKVLLITRETLSSFLPSKENKLIKSLGGKQKLRKTSNIVPTSEAEIVQKPARRWSQFLAIVPIYILQICYGMNSGFPAILTPQLREPCSEFQITEDEESWIVSVDNVATPIICVMAGFLQQRCGPLRVLMFSCIPYCFGWLITAQADSVEHLYLARILVGVSHALLTTTVYTIEVSSREMRGTYSVLESVLRCSGCVLMYTLGLFFRWRNIATYSPLIPMVAFVACFFVPESPVFLISKGKQEKAQNSLKRLYGPDYQIQQEVEIINNNLDSIRQCRKRKIEYLQNLNQHPEIYKPFLIIVCLSVVQQFSGVSVIRAYVVRIFDEVFGQHLNIKTAISISPNATNVTICEGENQTSKMAYLSAVIVGVFRLAASLALAKLLRKYERRSMYFCSMFLNIICLIAFATMSYLSSTLDPSSSTYSIVKWGSLVATCSLVFSVQLGVQTLPFLLSGELFPSDVRATFKGLTRAITCIFLVLLLKFYPFLESSISMYGTFFLFAGVLTIFIPIIYCILPETKDLGLEMIQQYFTPVDTVWYIDSSPNDPEYQEQV